MAKKRRVFLENGAPRIRLPQQTPIENANFGKKAPNALKQSTGEQVKTSRRARREPNTVNPLSPRRNSFFRTFWGLTWTKPYAPSITPASAGKRRARPRKKVQKLVKKHSPSPGGWWAGWVGGGWLVGWLAGLAGGWLVGWVGKIGFGIFLLCLIIPCRCSSFVTSFCARRWNT